MSTATYPVTLYSDAGYSGTSINADYGQYPWIGSLGFPNDSLSALTVAPFTKVTLYSDGNFGGSSVVFTGPVQVPDLRAANFNDTMSSMQVVQIAPDLATQMACCNGTLPAYQCAQYIGGSSTCANVMAGYCSSHLSESACRTWCDANPAICDPYAQEYCNQNPTDPFCACIKSPVVGTAGNINPKCVDRQCLNGGYLTSAMRATSCPTIIDCNTQVTLNNSGVILSNTIPIQQNCGNTTSVPPVVNSSTSTTTTGNPLVTAISQVTILHVLMFIILIALVLLGAYAVFGGFDDSPIDETWFY